MRMPSRSKEAGAIAIAAGLCCSSAACVSARDSYDDFGDRIVDAAPAPDAPPVSTLPDVDGEWLMTTRPNLPEDRFLYFRVTVTLTQVTENTGTLAYTGRALDWRTLEPVGETWSEGGIAVGADATFEAPLVGTLPAEANSITETQVLVNGLLHGTLIADDFVCGTLTGDAGGLGLEGTTWASVRITGDMLPDPVWRCEDRPE